MTERKKPHVWFTMSGVLAATAFPSAEDPERMGKPPRNNPGSFQPLIEKLT